MRSRDVLEHIERVVHHVRRLEQNAETAVQMHFSAQSNRTNDIMRTLTVLTADLPAAEPDRRHLRHELRVHPADPPARAASGGPWASMVLTAVALGVLFWRKRYLARTAR